MTPEQIMSDLLGTPEPDVLDCEASIALGIVLREMYGHWPHDATEHDGSPDAWQRDAVELARRLEGYLEGGEPMA